MTNEKLKDPLFYSDLIYKIKTLAGIQESYNDEIEKRILKREEMIGKRDKNGLISYNLSAFSIEVFKIIYSISKKVKEPFKTIYEIRKYPKLVNEVLLELERKNKLYVDYLMRRQGFHLIETSKSKTKPFEVAKELEEKLMKLKLTLEVLVKEDEAFENKENNLETTSRRLIRKILQVGI